MNDFLSRIISIMIKEFLRIDLDGWIAANIRLDYSSMLLNPPMFVWSFQAVKKKVPELVPAKVLLVLF